MLRGAGFFVEINIKKAYQRQLNTYRNLSTLLSLNPFPQERDQHFLPGKAAMDSFHPARVHVREGELIGFLGYQGECPDAMGGLREWFASSKKPLGKEFLGRQDNGLPGEVFLHVFLGLFLPALPAVEEGEAVVPAWGDFQVLDQVPVPFKLDSFPGPDLAVV